MPIDKVAILIGQTKEGNGNSKQDFDRDFDSLLISHNDDENYKMEYLNVFQCCKLLSQRLTTNICEFIVFRPLAFLCIMLVFCPIIFIPILYIAITATSEASELETLPKVYNTTEAYLIVDSLCAAFLQNKYAGDFCEILCAQDEHRNWTMLDYIESGNKRVLKMHYKDKDLILKMQHPYHYDYDQQVDFRYMTDDEFMDKMVDIVNEHLHLDWPKRYKQHLLRKVWPSFKAGQPFLSEAEKRSIWALLQQDEFINVALLPMSRVTPKLLGVCGHAYRSEYLIPFRMKPYYMNLKAKILVHLMGTLKLFYEFLNEPLQWCDVKFENLGLSADYPKRFVMMDSDMLYTESKLNAILTKQRCKNDSDCGLFDCESLCNITTGFCTTRTNDNIDVFCKKLVYQLFGNFWSKSNQYLAACHNEPTNGTMRVNRLNQLRLVWSWTLSDV